MSVKSFFRGIGTGINRNADILMTMSALLGLGTTVYLTYKNTPDIRYAIHNAREEAHRIEEQAMEENWYENEVKEAKKELIVDTGKVLLPIVAPPLAAFVFTSTMIVCNNVRFRGEKALLTTALNGSTLAFQEFKDEAREALGEKKVQEIEERVSMKHLEAASPPIEEGVILVTGHGDKLYSILKRPYDEATRVYFRASPEWVKMANANANEQLACGGSGESSFGQAYLTYGDYVWYIDKHLYDDMARNWIFTKDEYHKWVTPRYKSHVHPYLQEACCDITFDPGDWQM